MNTSARLSRQYGAAFQLALFQQALVFSASAVVLEWPRASLFALVATVGHWLTLVGIVIRRPELPTKGDLLVFRFGFVPVLVMTGLLAPLVWQVVGEEGLLGRRFAAEGLVFEVVSLGAGLWVLVYPALALFRQRRETRPPPPKHPTGEIVVTSPERIGQPGESVP